MLFYGFLICYLRIRLIFTLSFLLKRQFHCVIHCVIICKSKSKSKSKSGKIISREEMLKLSRKTTDRKVEVVYEIDDSI